MLKRLFWVAVGAALALEADRFFREQRARFTPNALTGALLDKLNERLEAGRTTPPPV
jgi:hypothetical protein